jgi:nitrogen fixation-related uncharacterized protein
MKPVAKVLIGVVVAIVVVAIGGIALLWYFMTRGSDLAQFEHLKQPQITSKPNQKMVVVEAKGDPNVVGQQAFGLLFSIYYNIKNAPKSLTLPAPRARWPVSLDTPKSEWVGLYALPVPEITTALPQYEAQPGLMVSLATWEYAEVAEILHIGPYDQEQPATQRLMDFVNAQGYATVGEHEEEYLKGPTMFSKGDPEKYATIIRYRVKKSDQQ